MRFNHNDEFLGTVITRHARYGGGGYKGPSVQEQDWLATKEAERQKELMRTERELAESEAKRQREEAEAAARGVAEEEAEELAMKTAAQEASAQAASDAAAAQGAQSSGSLSYRDVNVDAFRRGLIPDPTRPE